MNQNNGYVDNHYFIRNSSDVSGVSKFLANICKISSGMNPLVTIIITSYNRSKTIARAVDSALHQTYNNTEIIIVEDGSTDDTVSILKQYDNAGNIITIHHETNKGVTAAKNTGLRNIKGEWFTFLDSDDEMLPDAVSTMMQVVLEKDNTINAVACNCIDSVTGDFTGKGLDKDQFLDFETIIRNCSGEFWGITKTGLLGDDTFNEQLSGTEDTLWFKINEKANRYYLHKGLRVYHTEGLERITVTFPTIKKKSAEFRILSKEFHLLESLKKFSPGKFKRICEGGIFYLKADNKKSEARFYYDYIKNIKVGLVNKVIYFFIYYSNPVVAKFFIMVRNQLKRSL